ncbi:MAG: GNAT family N-acetyltransferase [Gaiellales bacterium]
MQVEIRTIELDELEEHVRAVAAGFLDEMSPEWIERVRRISVAERSLAAIDGGTMVGTAASLPFELSVPGGSVPAGGVTAVTVQPTHRRRGLLRRLMERQLGDLRAAGDAVAVLWASEGWIYPRFGYGLASLNARLDAQRDRIAFRDEASPASVRLLSHGEALEALPPLYERIRVSSPGFYARSAGWWDAATLADDGHHRRGAGPLFRALLERRGAPAAYGLYRLKHVWNQGVPEGELHVQEALGVDPEAYREIWRYLFGIDLVARVQTRRLAVDSPLALLVTEPTRLRISVGDGLFLRIIDLEAALSGRGSAADGAVVLGVVDEGCPWNDGAWQLDASGGRIAVARSTAVPELRLAVGDLASVYLGAFSFGDLAAACRVEEVVPGAVARADAIFRTDGAPWCPEGF